MIKYYTAYFFYNTPVLHSEQTKDLMHDRLRLSRMDEFFNSTFLLLTLTFTQQASFTHIHVTSFCAF